MSGAQIKSHWPLSILSGCAALVNMLLPLILVRVLSPQDVGVFKMFFLYLVVVPHLCGTVGIMSGLAYWAGRGEAGQRAIRSSAQFVLMIGAVVALLTTCGAPVLAEAASLSTVYVVIFSISLFGAITSGFFEEAAIASGNVIRGAVFQASWEVVRTLIVVVVALWFKNVLAVFIAHMVIVTIKSFFGYLISFRMGMFSWKWDWNSLRPALGYAMPVSLAAVFSIFVNYTDQLVLSATITPQEFAFYTIGCLALPPLFIIEQSITRMLIPQLSSAFSGSRSAEAASLFRQGVAQLGFLLIPSVAGLAIFASPIIRLLFTEQYAASAGFLSLFALSYAFLIFPYDAVQRARGEAQWILKSFLVFSLISLLLVFGLGFRFGAFGALIGMLVAKALMRGYSVWYIRASTGWSLRVFIPITELGNHVCMSLALGIVVLGVKPIFTSELAWFFVCAPIFAVVYLVVLGGAQRRAVKDGESERVVIVAQQLMIGGLERLVVDLCANLDRRGGWKPAVFLYDHLEKGAGESFLPELHKNAIDVRAYKKPEGFSPRMVLLLAKYVRECGATVIHSHNLGALIYASLSKILLCGRVRLVHTQHSFLHLSERARYARYERFFSWFADEIVAVSEDTRRIYADMGIARRRVHLVRNGIELGAFNGSNSPLNKAELRSKLLKEYADDFWILYLARLHPVKGQVQALKLWEKLSSEARANSVLIFVGPEAEAGELLKLESCKQALPDRDRVIFVGGAAAPQEWYRSSDMYLSLSEFEGMPLAPLEALAAELPTVLSDIPGHNFLRDRAQLYPLHDLESCAKAVQDLILMRCFGSSDAAPDELLKRQKEACWVRETFTVDTMTREYERLYSGGTLSEEVLAEPTTPRVLGKFA